MPESAVAANIDQQQRPQIASDESYFGHLSRLGLSSIEAKVYVTLLKSGPSGARTVSNIANVNRVDSYRTLKSLARKGLVEIVISKPSIYVAASPDLAIRMLVGEKERQLANLKTSSLPVQSWLESIRNKQSALTDKVTSQDYVANFSVKLARQTFAHYQTSLSNAKKEILLVWSSFGLRIHHQEGTMDLFKACYDRGVHILGITEKSGTHSSEIRNWSKFASFRFLKSTEGKLRYMIVDGTELILAMNHIPCEIDSFALLSTKNRTLVRGFEVDFYNLWNAADPEDI